MMEVFWIRGVSGTGDRTSESVEAGDNSVSYSEWEIEPLRGLAPSCRSAAPHQEEHMVTTPWDTPWLGDFASPTWLSSFHTPPFFLHTQQQALNSAFVTVPPQPSLGVHFCLTALPGWSGFLPRTGRVWLCRFHHVLSSWPCLAVRQVFYKQPAEAWGLSQRNCSVYSSSARAQRMCWKKNRPTYQPQSMTGRNLPYIIPNDGGFCPNLPTWGVPLWGMSCDLLRAESSAEEILPGPVSRSAQSWAKAGGLC